MDALLSTIRDAYPHFWAIYPLVRCDYIAPLWSYPPHPRYPFQRHLFAHFHLSTSPVDKSPNRGQVALGEADWIVENDEVRTFLSVIRTIFDSIPSLDNTLRQRELYCEHSRLCDNLRTAAFPLDPILANVALAETIRRLR